jgi:hypothetical protein
MLKMHNSAASCSGTVHQLFKGMRRAASRE